MSRGQGPVDTPLLYKQGGKCPRWGLSTVASTVKPLLEAKSWCECPRCVHGERMSTSTVFTVDTRPRLVHKGKEAS